MLKEKLTSRSSEVRSPVLFIGHGSPMNAIEENAYTRRLHELGKALPKPKAILCVSAHWLTNGTWVTHMTNPKTIHDFGGFPQALFDVEYPAPGSPETATLIQALINDPKIKLDDQAWGLDHGTWSVLTHLYPNADIPVVQLSIDASEDPEFHLEMGTKLRKLRDHGILILGSGNIVHNLRQIKWQDGETPYPWTIDFDQWVKERLVARDYNALAKQFLDQPSGRLAVPTLDHYLPLLYVVGASDEQDQLKFEYEGLEMGSLSMRSLSLGRI